MIEAGPNTTRDRSTRRIRPMLRCGIALVLACALTTAVRSEQRNVPEIELAFDPQQIIGEVEMVIHPTLEGVPVRLEVHDGREDRSAKLGVRTDDRDRQFDLTTETELIPFVADSVRRTMQLWRLRVEDDAQRTLSLTIERLEIMEYNQAVGASFESNVHFRAELQDEDATVLWSGYGRGDGSRYGRKFSSANCNEVLSDAIVEATAEIVNQETLQAAWVGQASIVQGVDATVVDPDALLAAIQELLAAGFADDTIVSFVERHTLTRLLTASELIAWKSAGVSEEVIQAVLEVEVLDSAGMPAEN